MSAVSTPFRDLASPRSTTERMTPPAQALATAPIPPQNLDAEESVLGAMMLNALAIGAVTESTNLSASDFYRESHGHVYRAILSLYAKGEPVDAITRGRRAREDGHARGGAGRGAHPRARCARPGRVERAPLRAARRRDGDACAGSSARATTSLASASTGPARRSSSSTAPSRSSSISPSSGSRPSSRTSPSCSRIRSRRSRGCTRPEATSRARRPASAISTASPPGSSPGTS